MATTPTNPTDATPLGEAVRRFEAEGYTAQLAAQEGGNVVCYACHTTSHASEIELDGLIRSEGASDPDDMTATAAVRCPHCGAKGTLVLQFGPMAPPEHDDVLRLLDDRRVASGTTAGPGD